jgi:pimeloyl-ACP methyl ester carboxylesterase
MAQYPIAERRLDYASDDGQPLFAYLVGDPARAPGLLIAYHGNADLAAWVTQWASEVARATGWAVLVPEYRGYGGLPGAPTYLSSQRDARATYRLAREQLGLDSARIALYGHSLGSAIATELAIEHPPAVLILEAPFTSAREMARGLLAPVTLLWSLIARVHFDTRAKVAALGVPTWVVHGERDGIIPVRMGRAVFAAARVPGELFVVPGAGHNDVSDVAGDAYWEWLRRALHGASIRR